MALLDGWELQGKKHHEISDTNGFSLFIGDKP